jgi:hypothetical protein
MNDVEAAKTLDIFFDTKRIPQKWKEIDKIEGYIASLPVQVTGDIYEEGTPGLYTRQITLPKGTLLTSRIHKTCHPFVVLEGAISVYNTLGDTQDLYTTGYRGVTMPGTRRVLYTHELTKWVTFHPTDRIGYDFFGLNKSEQQSIFDEVMKDIIQEYYNPALVNFDEGIFI